MEVLLGADVAASMLTRLKIKPSKAEEAIGSACSFFASRIFLSFGAIQICRKPCAKRRLVSLFAYQLRQQSYSGCRLFTSASTEYARTVKICFETNHSCSHGHWFCNFRNKGDCAYCCRQKICRDRALMVARIKNTRTPFSIDFGVGDSIRPYYPFYFYSLSPSNPYNM